jgi:hypothetical protein
MPNPTVPLWAPGHLSSMLEAGKRLLHHNNTAFSLTVLLIPPPLDSDASDVTSQVDSEAAASDHAVTFHRLPPVEHDSGLVHPSEYVELHALHVANAVAGLAAPVVDWFGTTLLDVARELAVPGYVYFTSTAALLSLMLRLPTILDEVADVFREEKTGGVVDVPGLPASCMPSQVENDYAWFAYHGRRFMDAEGIIINSAVELEPDVLAAIADGRCVPGHRVPTLCPIGPVLPLKNPSADGDSPPPTHECVRWLDVQPPASVVFLCFGSSGWMTTEQAREVADGLERSGHRFMWVLLGPPADPGVWYPTNADFDALLVSNRTFTLIDREDDTRSFVNFLIYFSHSTTMSCPLRSWRYILICC